MFKLTLQYGKSVKLTVQVSTGIVMLIATLLLQ
jgi:hypothetical protein